MDILDVDFMAGSITGPQVRAARGLLNMSVKELSERTHLAVNTIKRAETAVGELGITPANSSLLVATFEAAGVEFIEATGSAGAGVRFATHEAAAIGDRRRRRSPMPPATGPADDP